MPDVRALAAAYGVRIELADLGDWATVNLIAEYDPDGPVIRVNDHRLKAILRQAQDDTEAHHAEPAANITAEPHPNTTDEPHRNTTDEPHRNVTDEPQRNITDEPHRNVTAEPRRNVTDEPHRHVTDELRRDVTDEPQRNITDEPRRGVTLSLSKGGLQTAIERAIAHELYHHREAVGEIARIADRIGREAAADAYADAMVACDAGAPAGTAP